MVRYISAIFCRASINLTFSQNLDWEKVETDIDYLNSQRSLFSKVENWLEGTRVESILMDSIYILKSNDPKIAELAVYHSGSFDPRRLTMPLKNIISMTHNDYGLNLHVPILDPPVYSFRYKENDVFMITNIYSISW